jgi:hypothetical protein
MTKATDTHSEYVIFPAFPRQQWLHERVSLLLLYVSVLRLSGESIVFTSLGRSSYVPGWQHPNVDKTGSFDIILHSLLDAVCQQLHIATICPLMSVAPPTGIEERYSIIDGFS